MTGVTRTRMKGTGPGMRSTLRFAMWLLLVVGVAASGPALHADNGQPPAGQEQQDEFVPISELPPQDQLPAAPLLIGAYVFVLAVFFAYVLSVARRLSGVQRDIARLEGDLARRGRT